MATSLSCKAGNTEPQNLPVASVRVTPDTASVVVGQTTQLIATALDFQGRVLANRAVSWSSTNGALATVSASGLVTAVAVGGPVAIVATSEGQDGVANVTVLPPPVASVSVLPASVSVTAGSTAQLAATLRDAQGNVLTNRTITWSSSNTAVASVSNTGLVSGVAAGGPVTITATSETRTGTAAVTVVPAIVTTVTLSPTVSAIAVGGTVALTATVRDQSGNLLTNRTVSWSSSNVAVATVSTAGLVTGVSEGGPVTITATSDGVSGTASVTVSLDPCNTNVQIVVGQILSGTLAATDCQLADESYVDFYRLIIGAAVRIQIDVTSTAFDAFVLLYEVLPDGSIVGVDADNDSGPGADARLFRNVNTGETYLIGANSLVGLQTGAYQISLQTASSIVGPDASGSIVDTSARARELARILRLKATKSGKLPR